MHILIIEANLKTLKPIHHWICLFMESKKFFFSVRTLKDTYKLWVLQSFPSSFLCWNGLLLSPHEGVQGQYYTLMDLPVHGEQVKPSPVFVAVCFSCEL